MNIMPNVPILWEMCVAVVFFVHFLTRDSLTTKNKIFIAFAFTGVAILYLYNLHSLYPLRFKTLGHGYLTGTVNIIVGAVLAAILLVLTKLFKKNKPKNVGSTTENTSTPKQGSDSSYPWVADKLSKKENPETPSTSGLPSGPSEPQAIEASSSSRSPSAPSEPNAIEASLSSETPLTPSEKQALILDYDDHANRLYVELKEVSVKLASIFLECLVEIPGYSDTNLVDLKAELLLAWDDFDKPTPQTTPPGPFEDPELNNAYQELGTLDQGKKAQDELKRVVAVLGNRIDVESVKGKITKKYDMPSAAERKKSDAEKKKARIAAVVKRGQEFTTVIKKKQWANKALLEQNKESFKKSEILYKGYRIIQIRHPDPAYGGIYFQINELDFDGINGIKVKGSGIYPTVRIAREYIDKITSE